MEKLAFAQTFVVCSATYDWYDLILGFFVERYQLQEAGQVKLS